MNRRLWFLVSEGFSFLHANHKADPLPHLCRHPFLFMFGGFCGRGHQNWAQMTPAPTTHTLGSDVSSSTACGLGARVFQPGADLVGLRLTVPRVLPVRGGNRVLPKISQQKDMRVSSCFFK